MKEEPMAESRWNDSHPWCVDADRIASLLEKELGGYSRKESYAGGTPGMTLELPLAVYEKANNYLVKLFGRPKITKKWHPSQVGDPSTFLTAGEEYDQKKVHHVHLMQQAKGRRKVVTVLSWM